MHHDPLQDSRMSATLQWALDSSENPALASANWLAEDIDPSCHDVAKLLANRDTSLDQLRKAKSAFKTMRVVGETAADRRLGGHLYAATIAAALVYHGTRISTQSERALRKGFQNLADAEALPEPLVALGNAALNELNNDSLPMP
jgi:hypothetical protein